MFHTKKWYKRMETEKFAQIHGKVVRISYEFHKTFSIHTHSFT